MVNIYIQGQLLDQYDDEVIEITSSVLDVSDLTKNTGDFSKTFTIPASPTNNKHFQHWYNASIDDGFDARTKVDGHIDIMECHSRQVSGDCQRLSLRMV